VRITGQLIDALTGAHLWADRFDGALEDIFDLQDQVTASVVGAIAPKLEHAEIERIKHKPTDNLDAYDCYLRGMAAVHLWTREGNEQALAMFRRAIDIDPDFAAAHGMAARCYAQRKGSGWMVDVAAEIAEAERYARRAAILGRDDAIALCAAGLALALVVGDIDAGADLTERSILISPNLATAWLFSSWVNIWKGEPEVAIEHAARAVRLSPYDPQIFNMQAATAMAHLFLGRYAEASSWADRAVRGNPQHSLAASAAAASCALGDRPIEAQKAMVHLRAVAPALRISNLKSLTQLRRAEHFDILVEGLRKAGLPD
jgi:tetratricopeptide (TPR) repeat protein